MNRRTLSLVKGLLNGSACTSRTMRSRLLVFGSTMPHPVLQRLLYQYVFYVQLFVFCALAFDRLIVGVTLEVLETGFVVACGRELSVPCHAAFESVLDANNYFQ